MMNKYDQLTLKIKQQLIYPLKHQLLKLQQIANGQQELQETVNNYQIQHQELEDAKEDLLDRLQLAFNKALYISKQEQKKQLEELEKELSLLNEKYNNLNQTLLALCDNELQVRINLQQVKEEYRSLKNYYMKIKHEYVDLSLVDATFSRIGSSFLEIETLINNGTYQQAETEINQINEQIDNLRIGLNEGANLIAVTSKLLVEDLKRLDDYYYCLQLGDVILNHLNCKKRRDYISELLKSLINDLNFFSFQQAAEKISEITLLISQLQEDLEKEESARIYYIEESMKVFNKVAALQGEFINIKKILLQQQQLYLVPKENERFEQILKMINAAEQDRDLLLNKSIENEVASDMLQQLQELADKSKEVNVKIKKLHDDIVKYRLDAETIFDNIGTYRLLIGEILFLAKQTTLQQFYQSTRIRAKIIFTELDKIKKVLTTCPINLDLAFALEKEIKADINVFHNDILNQIATLESVEQLIYKASSFRESFNEVDQALLKAEDMLDNGDINSAYNVLNSLKNYIGAQ